VHIVLDLLSPLSILYGDLIAITVYQSVMTPRSSTYIVKPYSQGIMPFVYYITNQTTTKIP
jgi:hypothetical protein